MWRETAAEVEERVVRETVPIACTEGAACLVNIFTATRACSEARNCCIEENIGLCPREEDNDR